MTAALAMAILLAAAPPAKVGPAPNTKGPVAEITALRARSNAAIAAHDRTLMSLVEAPDYTLLPGSSGTPLRGEELDALVGQALAEPGFVTYVRTPGKITLSESGKRAAETGTWVGRWRKPDGEMRITGVYQAMWAPTPDGWRLKNESFVTLTCSGSKACSDSD